MHFYCLKTKNVLHPKSHLYSVLEKLWGWHAIFFRIPYTIKPIEILFLNSAHTSFLSVKISQLKTLVIHIAPAP